MASWSSAAGHAAPWGTVATGTSCTTVTSRSTSTTRSTTRTGARPDATARVSSQARWRHDDEHHFGVLPRAGSEISDPHQPHARVCPGRRGDRFRPALVAATASPFVLVSPVFMHAPLPVCFVPTTLADPRMQEVCATSISAVLGGSLLMRLLRSVTALLGRLKDGGTVRNDEIGDGSADDQTGGARAALHEESKRRRERADSERRLHDLAGVLVATPERDAAVADAERRARHAARDDRGGGPVGERSRRMVRRCDEDVYAAHTNPGVNDNARLLLAPIAMRVPRTTENRRSPTSRCPARGSATVCW